MRSEPDLECPIILLYTLIQIFNDTIFQKKFYLTDDQKLICDFISSV